MKGEISKVKAKIKSLKNRIEILEWYDFGAYYQDNKKDELIMDDMEEIDFRAKQRKKGKNVLGTNKEK